MIIIHGLNDIQLLRALQDLFQKKPMNFLLIVSSSKYHEFVQGKVGRMRQSNWNTLDFDAYFRLGKKTQESQSVGIQSLKSTINSKCQSK